MNKWTELITGLALLIIVVLVGWASSTYSWMLFGKNFNFLHAAWLFLKGGVFWLAAIIALILIFLGINDLKE